MRRCLTTLVILALAFPIWGVPGFVMAASEINQQSTTEESRPVEDCQISDVAREAIENAEAAWMQAGIVEEALDLILQAERVAGPPECNSIRAKILADKAKRLSDATPEPTKYLITAETSETPETSETLKDDQPIFSLYDGAWEFGLSLEIIELKDSRGQSFSDDTLEDFNYGLHVGKEFFRTENWSLGGQVHIVHSNQDEILASDHIIFDATSFFVTARPERLPNLQFKLGVTDTEYENINGRESGSGLAYGVAIVTGDEKVRIHWLDYEVYNIGDDEFKSWSVSVVIVIGIALGLANAMAQ